MCLTIDSMGPEEVHLCSTQATPTDDGLVKQVIEARYIDQRKLMDMLKKEFGVGKFDVRVCLNLS
jgi:hypothetical protein